MTSPWNQHCANSIVSAHFRSLHRYGDRKSAPLCGSAAVARAFQCQETNTGTERTSWWAEPRLSNPGGRGWAGYERRLGRCSGVEWEPALHDQLAQFTIVTRVVRTITLAPRHTTTKMSPIYIRRRRRAVLPHWAVSHCIYAPLPLLTSRSPGSWSIKHLGAFKMASVRFIAGRPACPAWRCRTAATVN